METSKDETLKDETSKEETPKKETLREKMAKEVVKETWTTERLIIRSQIKMDIVFLSEILLDPNISQYLEKMPMVFPTTKESMMYLLRVAEKSTSYTILLKDTNEIIGSIGYIADSGTISISYYIASKFHNKGYASEASLELFNHIFESNPSFTKLIIEFDVRNIPSQKIAYKIRDFIAKKHPEYRCLDDIEHVDEIKIEEFMGNFIKISVKEDINIFFKPNFLNLFKAKSFIDKDTFPPEMAQIGNKFRVHYKTVAISKV